MNHIIQKQYLHVELNGTESDGLALQRSLPELLRHSLMPVIEQVLERFSPQKGHLFIERLEIDAGTLTLEQLDYKLVEFVAQALEKSLRGHTSPGELPAMAISGNIRHKTGQQSVNEALLYFLKYGSLPWSFRLPDGATLEQIILDSWQEAAKSGAVLRSIDTAILHTLASATTRKRLTYQFSPVFIETLLARLSSEGKLASLLEHHWPEATRKASVNRAKNTEPIPPDLPGSPKNSTPIGDRPDIKEGIYIDHAGLVLLHPFLPQFFEALGVVAKNKLLQPNRALCLLHFLATGQLIAPEYELILPKILCNMPLETPVESDVALTLAEQEEAAALLAAVIRNWDALGNTSPDGLRGTFLLRSGKVSLRGDDWLLQVESKGFDILLDQLPWGISLIKLPWMEKMLWVEWSYGAV